LCFTFFWKNMDLQQVRGITVCTMWQNRMRIIIIRKTQFIIFIGQLLIGIGLLFN